MTESETRMILAQVAALDNRRITDAVVILWYTIFDGFEYEEVKWALMHHARSSTEYLTPAHLITIIREKRAEYRMMNPSARVDRGDWLTFEAAQVSAAVHSRALRESGARYAVDVMDGYTPKELES